jgi:phosphonoacetaldehyde hydrolase
MIAIGIIVLLDVLAARHPRGMEHLEAVILDWAGTTMDYGCMAPVEAFRRAFDLEGVPISVAEARVPMGAHKREHIRQLTCLPAVRQRWLEAHGRAPGDADVERMFERFVPIQVGCLADYAALIDGTLEVVAGLRARGLRIGSTTGYTTEMMAVNLREAAAQGYAPDATVCASDVPNGRPYPYMCFLNAIRLGVSHVRACVKIDDTLPGIAEGRTAGMWTIGLAVSGNEVGLPLADWLALSDAERRPLRERAYERMRAAGADFVVDTIADVLPCIDAITRRLPRAA